VRVFYEVFGLETACLRYFNVYGSRQVYSDYSGVIIQFISCLEKNLPLVILGMVNRQGILFMLRCCGGKYAGFKE
jgi:nucleoside-diphosphate-sugar epimerase